MAELTAVATVAEDSDRSILFSKVRKFGVGRGRRFGVGRGRPRRTSLRLASMTFPIVTGWCLAKNWNKRRENVNACLCGGTSFIWAISAPTLPPQYPCSRPILRIPPLLPPPTEAGGATQTPLGPISAWTRNPEQLFRVCLRFSTRYPNTIGGMSAVPNDIPSCNTFKRAFWTGITLPFFSVSIGYGELRESFHLRNNGDGSPGRYAQFLCAKRSPSLTYPRDPV
mmetsp:Transcript_13618/g.25842  ORF Transcript_13618/g.25842 Transcript_13618/m.25842 type:complete len:225 (+) Transcript_13618:591-1265(+)